MKGVIDLGSHRIDERALGAFGFVRSRTVWRLSRPLGFGDLSLVAVVSSGALGCRIFDDAGEEYVLHRVEHAQGAFVGGVRSTIEAFRNEFVKACCVREDYHSPVANALLERAQREFGEGPEFLWKQFSRYAVLRRADNGKWYAVFMVISPEKLGLPEGTAIEVVNLRVTEEGPELDGARYFPGWHMNKKTWVTAVCDACDAESLCKQVCLSRARSGLKWPRTRRLRSLREASSEAASSCRRTVLPTSRVSAWRRSAVICRPKQ